MNLWKPKYNIENEIAKLQQELATIEETKTVVKSDWWKKTRSMLIDKIVTIDKDIVGLASDATKNADRLKGQYCMRTAVKGLLSGIETTLNAEDEIAKKLKTLQEVAEEAELLK